MNGSTSTQAKRYVTIDVAAAALGVPLRRAYKLAKSEGWDAEPACWPRRYDLDSIRKTANKRKARQS